MIEERQEDLDSFNCIFQELLKNQSDINQLYNEFEVGIKNTKNIVQLEKNNLPQNFNLENFTKKVNNKIRAIKSNIILMNLNKFKRNISNQNSQICEKLYRMVGEYENDIFKIDDIRINFNDYYEKIIEENKKIDDNLAICDDISVDKILNDINKKFGIL